MPIHLLPGKTDPTGTILPQQPLPRAMFGLSAAHSSFCCETNPAYIRVVSDADDPAYQGPDTRPGPSTNNTKLDSRLVLVTSGQTLDDMFKYLPSPPATRIGIAEATLRWRHVAPTAPDTLWCHPYFTTDPFVITKMPDVYAIGCQPDFATCIANDGSQRCRIVLLPSFSDTGILVLVGLRTLRVRVVKFDVEGMDLE